MSRDKSVQTGEGVTDRNVVKYSDDNIVTITVPGHTVHSEDQDILDSLAIVAHNTLRLRITPGKEYEYYQEISEDCETYDYCEEEQTPPPLPPRDKFMTGKKIFMNPLAAGYESGDGFDAQEDQKYRKDLRKYLGMSDDNVKYKEHFNDEDCSGVLSAETSFKKDLSKFLGVEKQCLEKMMTNRSYKKELDKNCQPNPEANLVSLAGVGGSEGYSSADLSSSSSGSCTTSLEYYAASDRLL